MAKISFDDQSTDLVARFAMSPSPTAGFTILIESGSDAGKSLVLTGGEPQETLVGQSPACALRLTDPTASRRHAALDIVGDRLRVRDLGSRNGTFIGAVQVTEGFAGAGDALTIGATVLRVGTTKAPGDPVPLVDRFGEALGVSREMRRLFPLLARLAATGIPVLIEGETGTGKEAVAQALHAESPRAAMPFVVFDCTAVAASLVESELFGHERGAFTGATARRRGVFEQAHMGSLFLDELGDLPLELQSKLLRVLETSQVRRVGGDQWVPCDVRVIAATRRDVEAMVTEGKFRDDLFHRLAVGRVALPPLRMRKGDVPLLVDHFCRLLGVASSSLPRGLIADWATASWPGNVRELRNAVTRHVALGTLAPEQTPRKELAHVPPGAAFERIVGGGLSYDEARHQILRLFEHEYTERMIAASGGNIHQAAEASGIALRYFQLLRARHRVRTE